MSNTQQAVVLDTSINPLGELIVGSIPVGQGGSSSVAGTMTVNGIAGVPCIWEIVSLLHKVYGQITIPASGAATISWSNGWYTSNTSYVTLLTVNGPLPSNGKIACTVIQNSGSSLTIYGSSEDVINFLCIGA